MLRDRMSRDGDRIFASLRFALLEDEATGMRRQQRVIAREQVGYLLAALGDEDIWAELRGLLEAEAEAVSDPIVRHGIERGLETAGPSIRSGF
jgi:hypothetical protein